MTAIEKLKQRLGATHVELYFNMYEKEQTLEALIHLYLSVKGEQDFVENFYEEDSLFENGLLKRISQADGYIQIYQGSELIAEGLI